VGHRLRPRLECQRAESRHRGSAEGSHDRASTLASIERMKQLASNLKATVIIQHDVRDIGKLPAFPAAAK
jgi:hypothetical protein